MDASKDLPNARVVVVTNLTRNVVEAHLRTVFGFYGDLTKVDLPVYAKCEYHRRHFHHSRYLRQAQPAKTAAKLHWSTRTRQARRPLRPT
jgi:hypothetical protein